MQYRLADRGVDVIDDNGNVIENIQRRRDRAKWDAYQAWLDAGNTPLPMPAPPAEVVSGDEHFGRLQAIVQRHFDSEARRAGFRNLQDAFNHCGFASSWRANAAAVGAWQVDCRVKIRQIRSEVQGGAPRPTVAELIAALPVLVLP